MDVKLDFIRIFFYFVAADAMMPKHRAINAHSSTPTQYIIFTESILQNVKKFNKSFFEFCWYGLIFFINIPTTQYKCAHHARQLLCHSMTCSLYNLIYHFYIVSLLPYGEKDFGQHWVKS